MFADADTLELVCPRTGPPVASVLAFVARAPARRIVVRGPDVCAAYLLAQYIGALAGTRYSVLAVTDDYIGADLQTR